MQVRERLGECVGEGEVRVKGCETVNGIKRERGIESLSVLVVESESVNVRDTCCTGEATDTSSIEKIVYEGSCSADESIDCILRYERTKKRKD